MKTDLFEDLPWLRSPPPPRFFKSSGVAGTATREYVVHRKKETWAYTVTLELLRGPTGKGRVQIRKWDSSGVLGRASFADLNEGSTLFEKLWEEAEDLTSQEEEKL